MEHVEVIVVPKNGEAWDLDGEIPDDEVWYASEEFGRDDEDKPWGVYNANCPGCGLSVTHVAKIEDVNAGRVDVSPENSLCISCSNPPSLN